MGLADGPVLPLSQTLMAQASDPARRGLNMGLMQNVLSNLLGSLVAPLVMVWLASHLGWRFAFYLTVIPGLLLAAAIAVFVHEPEQFAPKPAVAPSAPATDLLRNRNIVLCIAISGLMVGWMIVGWVFLPVYLTTVAGFTPQAMSVVMAVLGISGAVAGFGVPGLSDRIGRRPAMIGFCLIGALSPLAALYLSGNLMLLCLVLATGWIAGGTFSLFMATIPAESIEPTKVATAMAVIMGAGELLGGAGAPLVVGWFSDIHGLKSPLFAEIIFATTAALLSFCLKETAPRKAGLIDGGEGLPFTTRQRG
jgi:predicted MFS family arabinose efflux permease